MSEEDIRATRLEKVEQIKQLGMNPYAYRWESTHHAAELQEKFADLPIGEEVDLEVAIAGRIMTRRFLGKLAFFTLQDETGIIQLYLEKKSIQEGMADIDPDAFKHLDKLTDAGDIIGVKGTIRRTEKGELSLYVKQYTILGIRRYLEQRDFIEIETPVLLAEAGGADARPFITYHNTLEMELYLRIATELHLKRLIVGGFEKVFELGRIFRNEGISTRHNPEFTSIEVYQAYADYNDMMVLTEQF